MQKLVIIALQEIRIGHPWEAMDMENDWFNQNKTKDRPLPIEVFENVDTRKQLLQRSRYLLYKSQKKWTESQQQHATILFENYLYIEKAYGLTNELRQIYNQRTMKMLRC